MHELGRAPGMPPWKRGCGALSTVGSSREVGFHARANPPPLATTVDIEGLRAQEDLRALLDACEQRGAIRAPDAHEIVEAHDLTGVEQEALVRELDKRGIEIVEVGRVERPAVSATPVESTTDALQLFLRRPAAIGC